MVYVHQVLVFLPRSVPQMVNGPRLRDLAHLPLVGPESQIMAWSHDACVDSDVELNPCSHAMYALLSWHHFQSQMGFCVYLSRIKTRRGANQEEVYR